METGIRCMMETGHRRICRTRQIVAVRDWKTRTVRIDPGGRVFVVRRPDCQTIRSFRMCRPEQAAECRRGIPGRHRSCPDFAPPVRPE